MIPITYGLFNNVMPKTTHGTMNAHNQNKRQERENTPAKMNNNPRQQEITTTYGNTRSMQYFLRQRCLLTRIGAQALSSLSPTTKTRSWVFTQEKVPTISQQWISQGIRNPWKSWPDTRKNHQSKVIMCWRPFAKEHYCKALIDRLTVVTRIVLLWASSSKWNHVHAKCAAKPTSSTPSIACTPPSTRMPHVTRNHSYGIANINRS